MAEHQRTPSYLVRLRKGGQWHWNPMPSAKFISDYYVKFPADSTPGFLIDLGPDYKTLKDLKGPWPWKVISVQDLYYDDMFAAQTLLDEGWAAISYQWGEFLKLNEEGGYKVRPAYESREKSNLPAPYIPPNASPEMARAYDWGIPQVENISVENVKRALSVVGLRFVWWDGPCLPQKDCSKGFAPDLARNPPYPGPPDLPGELKNLGDIEMGKQKFVYSKATKGVVWLNQMDWTSSPSSSLQKILERTPRIIALDTVKTMIRQDYQALVENETPSSAILSDVLRGLSNPSANADATSALNTPAEWRTAIENFVKLLLNVREKEGWFRSLWSFQEGRLLTSQAFVDKTGNVLTVGGGKSYDAKGKPVLFPKTVAKIGDSFQEINSPSVKELTAFATLLAGQISLAYIRSKGHGTAAIAIPALVMLWGASDATSQVDAVKGDKRSCLEPVMQNIVGSGLLYSSGESPLELLLAARRTRFASLMFKDQYFAMEGVMGFIKVNDKENYAMDVGKLGYGGPWDDDKDKRMVLQTKWLTEDLPKAFFEAMVKRYQWLVLLFAKLPADKVKHWGAVSMGHFETIEPYCENILVQNVLTVDRKDWKYVLPQLTYLKDEDVIKLTPPMGTVGTTVLSNGSILKAMQAPDIICHQVMSAWDVKEGKAPDRTTNRVLLFALADNSFDYKDDTFNESGHINEQGTREIKPSNSVIVKPVSSKALGGINSFLLYPFESLGFGLVNDEGSTGVQKQTSGNNPIRQKDGRLSQRCLLIRMDVVEDTSRKDAVKGKTYGESKPAYFGGIVDVRNLVTREILYSEIKMAWQKPDELAPLVNGTSTNQSTSGTVPASNQLQSAVVTAVTAATGGRAAPNKTSGSDGLPPTQRPPDTIQPVAPPPPRDYGNGVLASDAQSQKLGDEVD